MSLHIGRDGQARDAAIRERRSGLLLLSRCAPPEEGDEDQGDREALAPEGELTDLQRAFREHHALQCGFCTPGFLTTAHAFLQENARPTPDEVRAALSGNVCRCTGYLGIVDAVLATAQARSQE